MVQTGPKINEGGLKEGLFKVWYQEAVAGMVMKEPKIPTPSQIKTAIISFGQLIFFINFNLTHFLSDEMLKLKGEIFSCPLWNFRTFSPNL